MEITEIQDWKWYKTTLVKKDNCVGKIHIPIFERGQLLIRFFDGEKMITKVTDTPEWFQRVVIEKII